MSRSRDIGTNGERAVVAYLRYHGWPDAERRALAGAHDLGDITGCPGLVWEVKAGRAAEEASDGLISDWLEETETERLNASADLGILVTKRKGFGPARAASWWTHVDLTSMWALAHAHAPLHPAVLGDPIHLYLSTTVALLRAVGYGTPAVSEAVA